MALQSSGQISLNDLHVEAGGTTGTEASMNDSDIRGLLNASANSQMKFNSFYGASAGIGQIAAGNSSYTPGSQYLSAYHGLYSTDIGGITNIVTPYITNHPNFSLSSRSTRFIQTSYGSGVLNLVLIDKGQVPVSAGYNGHPANGGWTSVTLSGNSQTRTLNRTAGNFVTGVRNINGVVHSQAVWSWSSQTNPFPSSDNTASFTVSLA
jgi:hypothetical protein